MDDVIAHNLRDDIRCPAPGCMTSWPAATTPEVLTRLIDLHARTAHPVAAPPTSQASAKAEKVKRPTISAAGTSEEWAYFVLRWSDYKAATHLAGTDVVYQLLECCDDALRRDLTRTFGALTCLDEPVVLDKIKVLAVRQENVMVARYQLLQMQQDRDEPVRAFAARLRGQAGTCEYSVTCSCQRSVDYGDVMVKDALIRGLVDDEIRLATMSESKTDTLEATISYIEAKESGKRSAISIFGGAAPTTAALTSSYRRQNRAPNKSTTQPTRRNPCSHCGGSGHGSTRREREKECPAYNKTCSRCGILHHLESVCRQPPDKMKGRQARRQPKGAPPPREDDDATAVFDQLCSLSDPLQSLELDHHVYNDLTRAWDRRASDPHPLISVHIRAFPSDVRALRKTSRFTRPTPVVECPALADTGCQSCLASTSLLRRLGLTNYHLIPVTMKMNAANQQGIKIVGALALRIAGTSPSGHALETRQLVYFTDECTKTFLSRQACVALGLIPEDFPTIGGAHNPPVAGSLSDPPPSGERCECPRRAAPPQPPTSLPFPATKENRARLERWLLDYYSSSTFNVCEHQPLPMMSGPPMRLMVDKDARPVAFHTPIPVPVHWQDSVKAGLDQDVRLGVIEPVPIGTPVTWCHRMVICPKKSGKPRRTVDFQPLNHHAARETHHTQPPFHQARAVPPNTFKTVFDAWNGYHSIPLDQRDRDLTTFITPWGRYRYLVAPQGYIASGDGYSRRFDEIVSDIPRKTKCVDDTLMWSDSIEESFFQAAEWLDVCGRNGITLNPNKFVFAKETVEFAGFEITPSNVRPCSRFLQAIRDFPTPSNITDIRSWFGLVNQVSYAFASAERMLPFRSLLKPGTPFVWTAQLDSLFKDSKDMIIEEIHKGVTIFDKARPTCLATDWSKDGIGFWVFQKHCACTSSKPFCCQTGWKITLVGSRFTSGAESRYAPIEGEALAVVDALDKARHFLIGCSDLTVAVDHKPLLKTFGDRSLNDIPNPRLRNLKEKSLRYRFRIVHIPGVRHAAADAVSRHPVGEPEQLPLPDDIAALDGPDLPHAPPYPPHNLHLGVYPDPDVTVQTCSVRDSPPTALVRSVTWDDIRLETASDPSMTTLLTLVEDGFPDHRSVLPADLRPFYQHREFLTSFDGVILFKDRVVVPPSLRDRVLEALHSAHQGVTQMCSRAESSVFWPGMTPAIVEKRRLCSPCNRMAPSQPAAPPTPPVAPAYPFQCIAADYFHFQGHNFLVVVDRYSNWPIVEEAAAGAHGLVAALRRVFVTYGISDELSSDGGPEFSSHHTSRFLQAWGVRHRISSVAFPHSNCRAELGVKTVKRILSGNLGADGKLQSEPFQRAMLQYRNTPDRDTGLSPAMCVFGRQIRDFIPIHPGRYQPHPTWQDTLCSREMALRHRHLRLSERLTEHTRHLPALVIGDAVRIQNQTGPHPMKWDKTGVVIEVRQFDQYVIRVDGSGRVTLRNRRFLRKFTPVVPRAPIHAAPFAGARLPHTPVPPPELRPRPEVSPTSTLVPAPAVSPPRGTSPAKMQVELPPAPALELPAPSLDEPENQQRTSGGSQHQTQPSHGRVPRALLKLQPHNAPGLLEQPAPPRSSASPRKSTRQSRPPAFYTGSTPE